MRPHTVESLGQNGPLRDNNDCEPKDLWDALAPCADFLGPDTQTEGAEDSGRLQEIVFMLCSSESQHGGPGATPLSRQVVLKGISRFPGFPSLSVCLSLANFSSFPLDLLPSTLVLHAEWRQGLFWDSTLPLDSHLYLKLQDCLHPPPHFPSSPPLPPSSHFLSLPHLPPSFKTKVQKHWKNVPSPVHIQVVFRGHLAGRFKKMFWETWVGL